MSCCFSKKRRAAFTLIELIGVLAVLAILAAVLIPKVFEAIHGARLSHAVLSVNTVKTGCIEHSGKFGTLAVDGSTSPVEAINLNGTDDRAGAFDLVLLKEGIMDKPFSVRLGYGYVEIAPGTTAAPDGSNSAYDLDGRGGNDATGNAVVQVVIVGMTLEDARALNNLIDGPALGENRGGNDLLGRVKYAKPASGNGPDTGRAHGHGKAWAWGHRRNGAADVYIYVVHK